MSRREINYFKYDAKLFGLLFLTITQKCIMLDYKLIIHFCVIWLMWSMMREEENNIFCRICLALFCLSIPGSSLMQDK